MEGAKLHIQTLSTQLVPASDSKFVVPQIMLAATTKKLSNVYHATSHLDENIRF